MQVTGSVRLPTDDATVMVAVYVVTAVGVQYTIALNVPPALIVCGIAEPSVNTLWLNVTLVTVRGALPVFCSGRPTKVLVLTRTLPTGSDGGTTRLPEATPVHDSWTRAWPTPLWL